MRYGRERGCAGSKSRHHVRRRRHGRRRPRWLIANGVDPFGGVAKYLTPSRLRIANLECVIATTGTAEIKPFTFRAEPRTIPLLARYFDGVSLANNHSGDFGKDAFAELLDLLDAARLPYFGGGRDLAAAHRPWVVERDGVRIAFLGYVEFKPRSFEAGANRPGVAWSGEDEQVLRDIRGARERIHADLVIPFMHWGWEDEGHAERTAARVRAPHARCRRRHGRRQPSARDAGRGELQAANPSSTVSAISCSTASTPKPRPRAGCSRPESTSRESRAGARASCGWPRMASRASMKMRAALAATPAATRSANARASEMKTVILLVALLTAPAFADSVHCHIIYGGENFSVVAQPTDDPYRVDGPEDRPLFRIQGRLRHRSPRILRRSACTSMPLRAANPC